MNTQMPKIKLLPLELTNQIAAGEVVERPASVIKELVENALDAKATEISVTVENGGQSLIRIEDNGVGIVNDELELAVTRHATSKLENIAGLSQISSYGFRGEALPSIASVSKFRIVSKAMTELEGSELNVEFGKVQSLIPSTLRQGTLIEVKDLFFNIPARLKFLKNPATELKKATELFIRLALIAKGATLSLYAGTRLSHRFDANEDLKERLAHIWPPTVVEALLPVSHEAFGISVTGFISHPRSHQPRADRMFFYVNGRAVSDKLLMASVRQAFRGKITTKDYPQCVLCVEISPQEIDVNVHPAKSEVRFRDEKSLFSVIMHSVGNALDQATHCFSAKDFHIESNVNNNTSLDNDRHYGTQDAKLGDLYVAKPQGFWGNADKERSLSFIKEEAEKKLVAMEAQFNNTSSSSEWHVSPSEPSTENPLTTHRVSHDSNSTTVYEPTHTSTHESPSTPTYESSDNPNNKFDYATRDEFNETSNHESCHNTSEKQFSSNYQTPFKTSMQEPCEKVQPLPNTYDRSHNIFENSQKPQQGSNVNDTSETQTLTQGNEEKDIIHAKNASSSLPGGLVYLGQIAKTYLILRKSSDALILLDQHAVHERILYEQIRKGNVNAQNLLVPIEFPLHSSEQKRIEKLLPNLQTLAFQISLKKQHCTVTAIPSTLSRVNATAFLKDILAEKTDDLERVWIHHACSSAIKANTELDIPAALNLITQWLKTEEPDYCPHGRPCVLHFDAFNLEQMFKRRT